VKALTTYQLLSDNTRTKPVIVTLPDAAAGVKGKVTLGFKKGSVWPMAGLEHAVATPPVEGTPKEPLDDLSRKPLKKGPPSSVTVVA